MNVEIGTEAAQFTEKEYINGILLAVYIDNIANQQKFLPPPLTMRLRFLSNEYL
jgi:hypothetical protein